MKKLHRADAALLARAQKSWSKDAESVDLEFDQPFGAAFKHAAEIIESRADDRYGIYLLCNTSPEGRPRAPYYRLVHVNHKLPKTPHSEIRFVWSQVCPHLAATSDVASAHGHIADYLLAAIALTQEEFAAKSLRLYAPDRVDMQAAKLFTSMWEQARRSEGAKGTPIERLGFTVVPNWILANLDA